MGFVVQMSPDGKWVRIDKYMVYILGPDDELKYPDGSDVLRDPYDMMRVDFLEKDGIKTLRYQYLVRRVAYLDADGTMVKTKNYNLLMDQVAAAQKRLAGCLPGPYFLCGRSPKQLLREVRP